MSTRPTIIDYDASWPDQFEIVAARVREALADLRCSVEHIGSTAVPGLAAKDVIDVMAVVVDDVDMEQAARSLTAAGWAVRPPGMNDHPVPGLSTGPREWLKRFAREPEGVRRTNLHVRVEGRANHRYALLFRDFLRNHPEEAASYAAAKRKLAAVSESTEQYAEDKDPVCDVIYEAAEQWADHVGWKPRRYC